MEAIKSSKGKVYLFRGRVQKQKSRNFKIIGIEGCENQRLVDMEGMTMAKYIVAYFNLKGEPITSKKLQLMLYYVDAWHLVHYGQPLLVEDFEAWTDGPVLREVFVYYKAFGYGAIPSEEAEDDAALRSLMDNIQYSVGIEEEVMELIEEVLARYASLSAIHLGLLVQSERPWKEARRGLLPHENSTRNIKKGTMKDYYGKLLTEYEDGED